MSDVKPESKIIAERLKELRQNAGLSHIQLSNILMEKKKVKISHDSLQLYEVSEAHSRANANLGMRLEYLIALADIYSVTTDYLLGRTDDPSTQPSAVAELGLSTDSISAILDCRMFPSTFFWLDKLLSSPDFATLLHAIDCFSESVKNETHFLHQKLKEPPLGSFDPWETDESFKLVAELEEKYPMYKNRIHIALGDSIIDIWRKQCELLFLRILEINSNYSEYLKVQMELREAYQKNRKVESQALFDSIPKKYQKHINDSNELDNFKKLLGKL